VAERDRSDTESIEFDFFDDSPTTERVRETSPPRRRPRLPTRPPAGGTPLLRLAALIAGGILLAVVLVVWISSCREDQKTAQYEEYMESVGRVSGQSADVGSRLNQLIFSSGVQIEDLQGQLDGLRTEQTQLVRRAETIDPPGPLRRQHQSLIQAMQLRVSGLNGLAQGLSQISGLDTGAAAGAGGQTTQTETTGTAQGGQTQAPAGLHGNSIAGVRWLPAGEELSRTEENTVQATDRLAFEVLVENSGDSQETQVQVNLTLQQTPEPERKEATIDAINPDETKSVVFRDFEPDFGPRTILRVTVEPVPGEENTNNNTAEYVVIFTFG
jgi:hypothetical protein